MNMDFAAMALAAFRVFVTGIVLGAGLPAIYAFGMRLHSIGAGETDTTPTTHKVAFKIAAFAIFAFVVLVILAGILLMTRQSIYHYTGISILGAGGR